MFSNAYAIVSDYMHPVIFSTRTIDKTVNSGLCAFIILNDEGWILTVAHASIPLFEHQKHIQERKELEQLIAKSKRKRANTPKENPKWIHDISYWWGKDSTNMVDVKIDSDADLMIGRLDPYDAKMVKSYPTIKNHTNNKFGTSLCKLGYPFYQISASFDDKKSIFVIPPNTFPIPRFPIEGIYTRDIIFVKPDGTGVKFIETSSPGLKGQSGGPIFDVKGNVWSIQSRTYHHPLGFNPKIKNVEENQFLNTGVGPHPKTIIDFLNTNGIKFNLSKE